MSRKLGRDMLMLINDVEIACARNYDLSMDSELIPLSLIQTGGYANSKQGVKNWTLSAQHLITWDAANFHAIYNYWDQGSTVTVKLQDAQFDTMLYSGTGWIKSHGLSTPHDNAATMGFLFIGTSPIAFEDWNLIDELSNNVIDESDNNIVT